MKTNKEDFLITYERENCYRLLMKTSFLLFFNRWLPVTYQETENTEDKPMEFKTFADASAFIDLITI